MSENESFVISRAVSPEEWEPIDTSVVDALDLKGYGDKKSYGHSVMLIRRRELYLEMLASGIMKNSPEDTVSHILEPILPSSEHPVVLPVEGVAFFGRHHTWRNLSLIVRDENGVLMDERNTYLERAGRVEPISRSFDFNVTLARIRPERATTHLLAALNDVMPETITLDAVEALFTKSHLQNERSQSSSHVTMRSPHLSNDQVRTVRPTPQAFLDSLRPKE